MIKNKFTDSWKNIGGHYDCLQGYYSNVIRNADCYEILKCRKCKTLQIVFMTVIYAMN